jgi:Ribbon-helix-helix protein, copG family
MTVTVKLDPLLEELLRQRAASTGRTTSEVIRSALQSYLAEKAAGPSRSAYALGQDLFGRHAGAPGLAQERKRLLADAWAAKQRSRGV